MEDASPNEIRVNLLGASGVSAVGPRDDAVGHREGLW